MNDKIDHEIDRLLKWLDKHVTEQRRIGLQPIAIILLIVALVAAVGWCIDHVRPAIH